MLKSTPSWEQLSSLTASSPVATDEQGIIAETLPERKRKGGRKAVNFMFRMFDDQLS